MKSDRGGQNKGMVESLEMKTTHMWRIKKADIRQTLIDKQKAKFCCKQTEVKAETQRQTNRCGKGLKRQLWPERGRVTEWHALQAGSLPNSSPRHHNATKGPKTDGPMLSVQFTLNGWKKEDNSKIPDFQTKKATLLTVATILAINICESYDSFFLSGM